MADKILVNADGASRNNPGKAAIGIIIWDEKRNELKSHSKKLGIKTNNEAEYHALIGALELSEEYTKNEVNVFMDSELIINQMNRKYKVRSEKLRPLHNRAKELELVFQKVKYSHVKRNDKFQIQVDRLVNKELDPLS